MRLLWLGLGLPGCFVITPGDVNDHDALSGDWEGEWEQEEGDQSGGLEVTFGKADWQGSVELWQDWSDSELQGLRQGDHLQMLLFGEAMHGENAVEFEMDLEATLKRVDEIDGDCVLQIDGLETPCTFSLRPL